MFHGIISVMCKFCYKLVESDHSGFFEAEHAIFYLYVDKTVRGNLNVIFVPNLLGDLGRVDTHILVAMHWGTKV